MWEFLGKEQRLFLSRGYLKEGQTAEKRHKEICDALERYSGIKGFSDKFYEYCAKGWVSFSTPVIINFGHGENLPVSCNFTSIEEDSLDGILKGVHELGMLSKYGAGTAVDFSPIRPLGAPIRTGGISEGVVAWVKLYEETINKVSQGKSRRGSMAAYLRTDHADILDFLDICTPHHPVQHITTGVIIDKDLIPDAKNGDKKAQEILAKILKRRSELGFPYIVFEENCYENIPDFMKDIEGLDMARSNLCVTGDQRVVSDRGLLTAKELYEQGGDLVLFDGEKQVKSSEMKLIEKDADVYRITLENGMTHDVTGYHKVKARLGDSRKKSDPEMVEALDLTTEHQVAFQKRKGLFGTEHRPEEAFLLGIFQADGTEYASGIRISIWENDFDLTDRIEKAVQGIWKERKHTATFSNNATVNPPKFTNKDTSDSDVDAKVIQSWALDFKKGIIPDWIWRGNEETQWAFIEGLLVGDGTVGCYGGEEKGYPCNLALASINKDYLKQVQIILMNLGVKTQLHVLREAGKQLLPANDGSGEYKEFDVKKCYRLIVTNKKGLLEIEDNTGFLTRKNIEIERREYRDNTRKYSKVVSVEHIGKQDVYCVTVDSKEHLWTCNGFITHNCNEVYGDVRQDETFVCVLSSVNLKYYDDWKDTDFVFDMRIALDCITQEYIDKATGRPGFERAVRYIENHRTVGLGVTGFHTYLQDNMIPWGSLQSYRVNEEMFSYIRSEADRANKWMGTNWGEAPYCKGTGLRGDLSIAIAPKKSTAFIYGAHSEGIQPIKSNYHTKVLAKIQTEWKNPNLEKVLDKYEKNTKEVWESIKNNMGSVQHLEFLSDSEREVFKTFSEISQLDVIKLAGQRQKYIDQGQSLNLMIHPDTPPKQILNLLFEAQKEGLKGLYYQYSINAAQRYSKELLECSACEG